MKSFDEWWNDYAQYRCGEFDIIKDTVMQTWQAAQEVQRESDARLLEQYSSINGTDLMASKIRNNK